MALISAGSSVEGGEVERMSQDRTGTKFVVKGFHLYPVVGQHSLQYVFKSVFKNYSLMQI